jgi:SPFH domain / Band 7 family
LATLIVLIVVAVVVLITLSRAIRIVPQARAGVVERLGRYQRTLDAGLALVIPYVDRVKPLIDLREQVVSFPPQPVITEDNLVINIDTVIYFQVTDPKAASYEIADYIAAIEQLTVTTLRNVIGGMTLEDTLTSRDKISGALRVVLDEATGKWGIRVNRVELKAVDPPASIQEAMEKQMRAERDRRAAILTAEGVKQSQILTAEGEKQVVLGDHRLRRERDISPPILTWPPRPSTRSSTIAGQPISAAVPVRSCIGVRRWRRAIGRRTATDAPDIAMNTIHWSATPPPASATIAAVTAAIATGPRKKPRVTISPTANTPAASIHQTHSSIYTDPRDGRGGLPMCRARASRPPPGRRSPRSRPRAG